MTVNTTAQGNISLNSIKNETNSSNITWSNTSLRSVSSLAGKSIPDAMSEFASTCRQLGLEELFLMALKLSGSSDKGKKDRTKDGDRKVGKGMSSRQGRH